MEKNNWEMFLTACVVGLIVMIASFESVTKDYELSSLKQSAGYQSFLALKNSESAFWSNLKGTKSNSGKIDNILQTAPPTETVQTPPQPTKLTLPVKTLLVGDSMMLVGFGPALENSLLKIKDVSVVREGAYSTGLNRIDYFDWFTKTDELIAQHKPDVLIVMFGGNDGQGIKDKDGKAHELLSESWKEIYRQRVNVYLSRTSPKVKKIYWVGHPMTGNEGFLSKFLAMNPIFQAECAKFPNAVFVDTWERFGVNGVYRQSIPDDDGLWQIAKQSDGVHVTDFGGRILAGMVIKEMQKDVEMK